MKISEAIKKIIKLKDFAVFDDYKRFIAMLADFSTDTHKKELNVFKNAVDDKMLKLCVDDTLENSRKILKLLYKIFFYRIQRDRNNVKITRIKKRNGISAPK